MLTEFGSVFYCLSFFRSKKPSYKEKLEISKTSWYKRDFFLTEGIVWLHGYVLTPLSLLNDSVGNRRGKHNVTSTRVKSLSIPGGLILGFFEDTKI